MPELWKQSSILQMASIENAGKPFSSNMHPINQLWFINFLNQNQNEVLPMYSYCSLKPLQYKEA